jgi:hypothetical protein
VDGNGARRQCLSVELGIPAFGVKCEIGGEQGIRVEARFTDTERPRVIFGAL